jgi:hypothetical protein
MLDNYLYEQTILTTATHLFEYDTYHVAKQLLKLRCQARSPLVRSFFVDLFCFVLLLQHFDSNFLESHVSNLQREFQAME